MKISMLRMAMALFLLASLLGANGATADGDARVTSVIGDTRGTDGRLAADAEVGDDDRLVTGEDGKCSMLVDGDLVLQLCESTAVRIRRDRANGRRIVQIDAGTLRVIAEPRLPSERVEIHTPAAIATLLGTIVHVSVDGVSGASTITSAHSTVSVQSADGALDGATILEAGEQLVVEAGSPPPAKPRRLAPRQLAGLELCVADLRELSLMPRRGELEDDVLQRLIAWDIAQAPGGKTDPGAGIPEHPLPGGDPNDLGEFCTPVECGGFGGAKR